jgi:hypothetical protein
LIWVIFGFLNPNFLSPRNLTNLMLQIAGVGTSSVGIVLVLLLGEIDLSVGAVSGVCAAVMAVLRPSAKPLLLNSTPGALPERLTSNPKVHGSSPCAGTTPSRSRPPRIRLPPPRRTPSDLQGRSMGPPIV